MRVLIASSMALAMVIGLGLPHRVIAQELRVIDSNGVDVGVTVPPTPGVRETVVALNVNSDWVSVYVTREGFSGPTLPAERFRFFHESADCSDPRYIATDDSLGVAPFFAYYVKINASNLFYETGPIVGRIVRAIETFSNGADLSQRGNCELYPPELISAGDPIKRIDLSTLGLVPPFTLIR